MTTRRFWILLLAIACARPLSAQQQAFVGNGPFVVAWDYQGCATRFVLYVDDAAPVPVDAALRQASFSVAAAGDHTVGVAVACGTDFSRIVSLVFTNAQSPGAPVPEPTPVLQSDPACAAPLGAHAPAIFLTATAFTTSRPGSRSRANFQLAAPDPIVSLVVRLDGQDEPSSHLRGSDLRGAGSVWFAQPPTGTHTMSVAVLTSYGCALERTSSNPIVVP